MQSSLFLLLLLLLLLSLLLNYGQSRRSLQRYYWHGSRFCYDLLGPLRRWLYISGLHEFFAGSTMFCIRLDNAYPCMLHSLIWLESSEYSHDNNNVIRSIALALFSIQ